MDCLFDVSAICKSMMDYNLRLWTQVNSSFRKTLLCFIEAKYNLKNKQKQIKNKKDTLQTMTLHMNTQFYSVEIFYVHNWFLQFFSFSSTFYLDHKVTTQVTSFEWILNIEITRFVKISSNPLKRLWSTSCYFYW